MSEQRHHFLDWWRASMIVSACVGHIGSGLLPHIFEQETVADDWDNCRTSTILVRWVASLRPYCLPLLFFTSGCCLGLTNRGTYAALKRACQHTLLGVSVNAALWVMGPMDPSCSVQSRCSGRGTFFAFTFCAHSNLILVLFYQMWYTAMLGWFLVVSWSTISPALPVPFRMLGPALLTAAGALGGISLYAQACVLVCEVSLVILVRLCPACSHSFVIIFAFVEASLAYPNANSFGMSFLAFACLIFHKFFILGWLCSGDLKKPLANAIISRAWPAALTVHIMTSCSTNWLRRGNLTYPFMERASSRVLYLVPAFFLILASTELAQRLPTLAAPCPSVLQTWTYVLYVSHPACMTVYWSLVEKPGVFGTLVFCSTAAASMVALTHVVRQRKLLKAQD